jgi:predicted permease
MRSVGGTIGQDIRYGIRQLRRTPGFAAAAIAALALSIGASATVFSVAYFLVLRPLTARDASGLARVYTGRGSVTSYPAFTAYRDGNHTFASLAAFQVQPVTVRAGAEPESTWAELVSADYFATLGIEAALGRTFGPAEASTPGSAPVAVLSHRYWTSRFGGDPSVIGRPVAIDRIPFTVVGVMPRSFEGALQPVVASMWLPVTMDPLLRPGTARLTDTQFGSFHMLGRLKPGVSLEQARADLSVIAAALPATASGPAGAAGPPPRADGSRRQDVSVYPARLLPPNARTPITIFMSFLLVVCGLVVLIACSNVANLLLARSSARAREIGVRQALGAGRRRLVRQLLTEGLLLSIAGGGAGLALAVLAGHALSTLQIDAPMPMVMTLDLDPRIVLFTMAVSTASTLLFALAPALQSVKADVLPALRGDRQTAGPQGSWLRAGLMTSQLGLSLLLLVTAGLCIQALRHATSADAGLDRAHVLVVSFDTATRGYKDGQLAGIQNRLLESVGSTQGVRAASFAEIVPLTLNSHTDWFVRDDEQDSLDRRDQIDMNVVSPGYFTTLGIPIVAGRALSTSDREGTPLAAVVNATLARQLFGAPEAAVGQGIVRGKERVRYQIVGVAADSTYVSIGEGPRGFVYVASAQHPSGGTLLVRAAGSPMEILPAIKRSVAAVDPDLAVTEAQTMTRATAAAMLPARAAGMLLGGAGLLALVLAAIGIYGTSSYIVRQRTREIGIRMALGARPSEVVWLVVRQTVRWTLVGTAVGLVGALGASRLLAAVLPGVVSTGAGAFIMMPVLLAIVALTSTLGPAWHAARIEPLVAFRAE